ncbi:hypothetical protein, partial [Zoogloea sp.]|uniref:hypothetical protein n=1 Tax=Zoogloea sp. TaxID=49181 RepID=UPI0031FE3F40
MTFTTATRPLLRRKAWNTDGLYQFEWGVSMLGVDAINPLTPFGAGGFACVSLTMTYFHAR